MSLTKEMMIRVEDQIECFSDEDLKTYNATYKSLNQHYPNSYYNFMIQKSEEEMLKRGIEGA